MAYINAVRTCTLGFLLSSNVCNHSRSFPQHIRLDAVIFDSLQPICLSLTAVLPSILHSTNHKPYNSANTAIMHFQSFTILSLAALSVALPTSLKTRQAGLLQATTFNDISIAGGEAGNAEQEALAVFSAINVDDPASISKADQDFLNEVNQVANDAEKEAFNPAVEGATGAEADAAQVCIVPFL